MSSNCSQRSNKRKFHAILCDCAFCKAHTYPNPLPNWECFCPECTDIQPAEMDEALNTSDIVQFLRRANNVECCCGLCATCIPDPQFFYTVYRHRISRTSCECPICIEYNTHLPLRRANAVGCECGVCATCIPDKTNLSSRQRRKFHSPLCNCVFCVDFYETHTSQIDPTWQCFCPECTDIKSDEMERALTASDLRQFLRRASNCLCTCGVCATCVSDTEFFYTVYWHKKTRVDCICPFCELYDYTVTTFNL